MIIILDNGEKYSQHQIRFIDIGTLPVELTIELLLRHANDNLSYEGVPFVHGVVEKIEWRAEDSLTPVADLWEQVIEHSCMVQRCRDKEIMALHEKELPYDVFAQEKKKIEIRAWYPEEYPCRCVSGELLLLWEKSS